MTAPSVASRNALGDPDASKTHPQAPLLGVTIKGNYYRQVYGGDIPAKIWQEFMDNYLKGKPAEKFPDRA